jgi:hypothetical protein
MACLSDDGTAGKDIGSCVVQDPKGIGMINGVHKTFCDYLLEGDCENWGNQLKAQGFTGAAFTKAAACAAGTHSMIHDYDWTNDQY